MGNISFLSQWPTARLMMLTALMAVAMPKAMAQTEQDETVVRTLSDNDQQRYRYFYLEALLQQEREHFAAAFDLFRHALEINPNAPEVHYELAGFYFMLKQPGESAGMLREGRGPRTHQQQLPGVSGQMLINRKDYARAITVYERLYKGNKKPHRHPPTPLPALRRRRAIRPNARRHRPHGAHRGSKCADGPHPHANLRHAGREREVETSADRPRGEEPLR